MIPTRLLAPLSFISLLACGGYIQKGDYGAGTDEEDGDKDGFIGDEDCNDVEATINPEAAEICNGRDDDCDGLIDLFDDSLTDGIPAYEDGDGDGFGNPDAPTIVCTLNAGAVEDSSDCDDDKATVFPGAEENCDTPFDDDCDGDSNDEGADRCLDVYVDADADGFGGADSTCLCEPNDAYPELFHNDCNDDEGAINPDAVEICGDAIDNNCDGSPGTCALGGNIDLGEADATVLGLSANDAAGTEVAGPGDLDGDGLADLAVSAPGYNGGQGLVGVFSGGWNGDLSMDEGEGFLTGTSSDPGPFEMVGNGDYDGDGIIDLIVASASANGGAGAAWLWSGPVSGVHSVSSLPVRLDGSAGSGVHLPGHAGDLNEDGAAELLLLSPNEGDAYLVWGPITASASIESRAQLLSNGGSSLSAATGIGDLTGDGTPDFAVGASTRGGAGRIWVIPGPGTGLSNLNDAPIQIEGTDGSDLFGASIARVGDLTDDGYDDVLVGAPGVDDGGTADEGVAYLFAGPITATSSVTELGADDAAHAVIRGERQNDAAGTHVAGGSDVNGDGKLDFLVSTPLSDETGNTAGMVYLTYGPVPTGTVELNITDAFLRGRGSQDQAGASIAMPGDMNGDGFGDIAVGSPGADDAASAAGAADIVFGGGL